MKKIVALFLSMLFLLHVQAIVVQKVYLKNGSVLNGYIQKQDKNNNITFRSENAIICISGTNSTVTDRVTKIENLDKKWIEWAEKNDAFNGIGNSRTLILNDVLFNSSYKNNEMDSIATTIDKEDSSLFEKVFAVTHRNVTGVKVLEKGRYIKYLELIPNTYSFSWDDVVSIKAERRKKTDLSGIERVYQLTNGREVRGQYAGESRNTLSLYTEGGMVETFSIDNVNKYFYRPLNPNQNIMEQSELLDVVRTKDRGSYTGIIVERNFTSGGNYLVIQQQNGASQILKFSEILEYAKEENSGYKPKYDVILKEGEVVVNRVAMDSVNVSKNGSTLFLDSINHKVVVPRVNGSMKIIVEYYNPKHLSSDHLLLVKVDKTTVRKKTAYSFSADIFEMKNYPAQGSETSVNNTTRVEYVVDASGIYALYDQRSKKAMPFIVK